MSADRACARRHPQAPEQDALLNRLRDFPQAPPRRLQVRPRRGECHGSFLGANVLVYLASADPAKADRAEQLIAGGGVISVQVLNELANVARRKMALTWPETHALLSLIRGLLTVQPLTIEVHETGLALAERYQLSTYDAMIAAAALQADCETLWSEDMQDGMVIEGRLRVVNPFRGLTPKRRFMFPLLLLLGFSRLARLRCQYRHTGTARPGKLPAHMCHGANDSAA